MLFGLPVEVLTGLASTVMGFVMKQKAQQMADTQKIHEMALEKNTANRKAINEARKFNTPESNWVRRFLVISFMSMAMFILAAPLLGLFTSVPVVEEGISFLGLFNIGGGTVYEMVEGMVVPEWLGHAIMMVCGMYFGQSVSSRKHL